MGSGSPIPSPAPNPNSITDTDLAKNCLQVICSTSCPEWCVLRVPPPPDYYDDDDTNSGINFSPLIIALITILGSASLLIIYYFFISKYCKRCRRSDDHESSPTDDLPEQNLNHLIVMRSGLDEGSIESITVIKYKRGDGLVESTECVVCLSEFKEDESLRLLPNCSHAFHINCIDVWLKSHSNCPICRANGDPFLPPPRRQSATTVQPVN